MVDTRFRYRLLYSTLLDWLEWLLLDLDVTWWSYFMSEGLNCLTFSSFYNASLVPVKRGSRLAQSQLTKSMSMLPFVSCKRKLASSWLRMIWRYWVTHMFESRYLSDNISFIFTRLMFMFRTSWPICVLLLSSSRLLQLSPRLIRMVLTSSRKPLIPVVWILRPPRRGYSLPWSIRASYFTSVTWLNGKLSVVQSIRLMHFSWRHDNPETVFHVPPVFIGWLWPCLASHSWVQWSALWWNTDWFTRGYTYAYAQLGWLTCDLDGDSTQGID
jgi:hypothetical protein